VRDFTPPDVSAPFSHRRSESILRDLENIQARDIGRLLQPPDRHDDLSGPEDDEELIREASLLTLGKVYQVEVFATGEDCIDAMQSAPADLLLLDIGLPGMSGIDTLKEIKKRYPDVLVIMITAHDDIDIVITAMKLGAYDNVVKPINMDALEVNIRNALGTIKLRKEVQILQEKYLKENLPYFIGESDTIQEVMHLVDMVANSADASVLILGETGTGKEFIASSVHYKSPLFKGPFVPVNCSAIPENLIERELFGYEKGAFSGAGPTGKKGLIELSRGSFMPGI
jgi:DNA-binding NtrC family response regulator